MNKYKLEDLVNKGTHARTEVRAHLIVSDKVDGYKKGDILDANTIVKMIKDAISGGSEGTPKNITSADIVDGTIQIEDLSEDVADKLSSVYSPEDEILYINRSQIG